MSMGRTIVVAKFVSDHHDVPVRIVVVKQGIWERTGKIGRNGVSI